MGVGRGSSGSRTNNPCRSYSAWIAVGARRNSRGWMISFVSNVFIKEAHEFLLERDKLHLRRCSIVLDGAVMCGHKGVIFILKSFGVLLDKAVIDFKFVGLKQIHLCILDSVNPELPPSMPFATCYPLHRIVQKYQRRDHCQYQT